MRWRWSCRSRRQLSRVWTGASSRSYGLVAATLPYRRFPRGDGWVFVELAGDDLAEVRARAERLLAGSGAIEGWLPEGSAAAALWTIRADGAGLAGVSLAKPAYAGWEDAAVPPLKLGAYLREFDALLDSYHLHGLPYGHFGDGCVHCRIDFPLLDSDGPGALSGVRHGCRPAGGLVRRIPVRRARRRSRTLGAAQRDVLAGRHRAVRPGQGAVRSAGFDEPGGARRPGPGRGGRSASGSGGRL